MAHFISSRIEPKEPYIRAASRANRNDRKVEEFAQEQLLREVAQPEKTAEERFKELQSDIPLYTIIRNYPELREVALRHLDYTNEKHLGVMMRLPQYVDQIKSTEFLAALAMRKAALSMNLGNREHPDAPISFEKGNFETFFLDIAQLSQDPFYVNDDKVREGIHGAFSHALEGVANLEKTLAKIQRGEMVVIGTGWEGHCITLVFYQGVMHICNRGEGAVTVSEEEGGKEKASTVSFNIDTSKLTLECLENEIYASAMIPGVDFDAGREFFYEELPLRLSPIEGQVSRCLNAPASFQSEQVFDTCPWSSTVHAFTLCTRLLMPTAHPVAIDMFNRRFLLGLKLQNIEHYLYYMKQNKYSKLFNKRMITRSISKLQNRLMRFSYSLLPQTARRLQMSLAEKYPHAAQLILQRA